jgi:hypothetical protein
MGKKVRHIVRGECPQCSCGDVSFIPSEKMMEKYIGSREEIEILCPTCGTKHKGKLEVIEDEKHS